MAAIRQQSRQAMEELLAAADTAPGDIVVVGCSSTSSYSVEELNGYLDASFYNLIMYGADMEDVEKTVAYLLEHDTVRYLVLNVYVDNGISIGGGEDDLTLKLHEKVSGADPLAFYGGYLMADPNYAMDKLEAIVADRVSITSLLKKL